MFWQTLSTEELLDLRIKDLKLQKFKTPEHIKACFKQLQSELRAKGLKFRPHFWISDEWFCPDGIAGIAVPFYLYHPKLQKLEKKMMGYVEGSKKSEFMKILRHEAGHAIDNAFNLRKLKPRQKIFGSSSRRYPLSYRPNPMKDSFVENMGDCYAQAHPDEDWAETFAVWLDPKSNWLKRYQNTKAMNKLLFMDSVMERLKGHKPELDKETYYCVDKIDLTLREFYEKKQKFYKISSRKEALKKVASKVFTDQKAETSASVFIRKQKANEKTQEYSLASFLDELQNYCKDQKLYLRDSEDKTISSFKSIIKKNKRLIAKDFSRVRL